MQKLTTQFSAPHTVASPPLVLGLQYPPTANAAVGAANRQVGPDSDSLGYWNLAASTTGDHLDLYLYGVIGDWWDDNEHLSIVNELMKHPNLATITLHLSSVGGVIEDGLAITNLLRNHKAEVTVHIDAFAFSIATVVMLCASKGKVKMARNAHLMIHNASGGAWGTADDLEKTAEVLRRFEDSIIGEYTAKTGKTADELRPLVNEETWFNAEEALAFGFVDEILEPVDMNAVADLIPVNTWKNMQASGLKNMPPSVNNQMTRRLSAYEASQAKAVANGAGQPAAAGDPPPVPAITPAPAAQGAQAQGGAPTPAPAVATPAPVAQGVTAPPATPAPDAAALQAQWQAAENQRRTDVTNVFVAFGGMTGAHAELMQNCLNDMNVTPDGARSSLLNALGTSSPGPVARGNGDVVVTEDEADKRIGAGVNALLARGTSGVNMEQGNPFAHMTLMDMAKETLTQAGVNYRGSTPMEIAGRAFNQHQQTTADFPIILERTISEAVLIEYARVADTWRQICAVGQVSDFRDHDRLRIGSIGNLDALQESGEYKNKDIPDGEKEKVKAKTKGNIIAVTRAAIINDDLGYFMNMSRWLGNSAARTIESDVYALLKLNGGKGPKLSDGKFLFHADHNNLATPAAMAEGSLDGMATSMSEQKDISKNETLAIDPALLLVARKKKMLANKWMNSQYIPDGTQNSREPNGVMGLADVVATSRVADDAYYLFADPSVAPVLEVVFLNGVEEPYIATEEGWRTDGAEIKVRLDYGVGVIDYRGAQYNAGA